MTMTMAEAKKVAAQHGCTLKFVMDTGEYRVNCKGGTERTAYYTSSREDAVGTAVAMGKDGYKRN